MGDAPIEPRIRRLTSDEFRDVIGSFASGVTVITTVRDDQPYGTTASAVASLSLEPPMLVVCMNKQSSTGQAIAAAGRFAVNILSEHQTDAAVRFASKAPDKFVGVSFVSGEMGQPLLQDALATLECRVVEDVTGGTHSVFVAEVERASGGKGAPLAYFRGQFGRLELAQDATALRDIRDRVLRRALPVGTPLVLDDLARELEVPRGSVYHALAKLTGEGLMERNLDGLFVVKPVTLEAVLDSARARFGLLLGAGALTIGKVSESELGTLRGLLDATRPVRDGRPVALEDWFAARTAFVDYMIELAGSPAMLDALRRADVPAMIMALWSGPSAPTSADLERIHAAYAGIVQAYDSASVEMFNASALALLDFYTELYQRTFPHATI